MKIFLVIRQFPDHDLELDGFRTRPAAMVCVKAVVRDHARDGVRLTREDDLWIGKDGFSVEVREVEVQ